MLQFIIIYDTSSSIFELAKNIHPNSNKKKITDYNFFVQIYIHIAKN